MNLQEYLDDTGMTKFEFARRAGLANATIWHILHGRDIRLSSLVALMRASKGVINLEDLDKARLDFLKAKASRKKKPKSKNKA